MSLTEVLELINNYGLPLVALIVIAIFAGKLFDRFFPFVEVMMQKALQIDPELIQRRKYVEGIHNSSIVDDALYKLMADTGAERVCVFQYHNGGKSALNVDFMKVSITHEVTNRAKPIIRVFQNLPVGVLGRCNTSILNHKPINVFDIETLKHSDIMLWSIFVDNHVKSFCARGLYDINGLAVGLIAISFPKPIQNLSEKDEELFTQSASYIAGLLEKQKVK